MITLKQRVSDEVTYPLLAFLAGLLGTLGLLLFLMLSVPTGEKASWYLTRTTGTVAYLLLTGSVAWGLLLSSRMVKEKVPLPLAMALHSSLSWLTLLLSGLHALLLLLDTYYVYTILDLVIPFVGPYRPGWVGLGTLGFYGLLLLSISFPARRWLGAKLWRKLHYLSFPGYVLLSIHGVMAGTDSSALGMRYVYIGSILLILFLSLYRLLSSAPAKTLR